MAYTVDTWAANCHYSPDSGHGMVQFAVLWPHNTQDMFCCSLSAPYWHWHSPWHCAARPRNLMSQCIMQHCLNLSDNTATRQPNSATLKSPHPLTMTKNSIPPKCLFFLYKWPLSNQLPHQNCACVPVSSNASHVQLTVHPIISPP